MILIMNGVAAKELVGLLSGGDDRTQIQTLGFQCARALSVCKRSTRPIISLTVLKPELRHDDAQLFRHHEQIVHYMLGGAGELLTQLWILGSDTYGAGV